MTENTCTKKGQTIRCQCGGQIAVGGVLHPLADIGFGFNGKKLEVETRYSRRIAGYTGFCMKCGTEGQFVLKGGRSQ